MGRMNAQPHLAVHATTEVDRFTAVLPPADGGRAFGGHLMALAVLAAASTAPGRLPHAVHAHFLRSGNDTAPVELEVRRIRQGREFSTRQVQVHQEGRELLLATVSLHLPDLGMDWQHESVAAPPPLPPAALPSALGDLAILEPFEVRAVHEWVRGQPAASHPYWVRSRVPLGDDPLSHLVTLVMLSDLGMPGTAAGPGLSRRDRLGAVSLDHAVWIHRQPRMDEWTYVDAEATTVVGHLGVARGTVLDATGQLLATSVQEAVLRSR
jgi:acyl-CoA thioesterase-2